MCVYVVDWRLSRLVQFVKHWAKVQGINDASQGTVSSYSLVLMVVHYLQCKPQSPLCRLGLFLSCLFIDRVAGEIIHLVASMCMVVRPCVRACVCPSVCCGHSPV